LSVKEAK